MHISQLGGGKPRLRPDAPEHGATGCLVFDAKLVAFNGEAWEHHGKIHIFFVYQ